LEGRALLSTLFLDHGSNNAMSDAQVVQLDTFDGMATISGKTSRRDSDVFLLSPTATGNLQLTLTDSGRTPVQLDILDSSGRRIGRETVRKGSMTGDVSVTAGQDVFLRVHATGRGAAAYQVALDQPSAVVLSPVRPNTGASTTMPTTTGSATGSGASDNSQTPSAPLKSSPAPAVLTLDSTSTARASGTITTVGGTDVYTLTAPRSGKLTFSIRRTGTTPVTLTVTDSTGKQRLKLDSDIPSFVAYFPAQQGETYTITIAARGPVPAPYSMMIKES